MPKPLQNHCEKRFVFRRRFFHVLVSISERLGLHNGSKFCTFGPPVGSWLSLWLPLWSIGCVLAQFGANLVLQSLFWGVFWSQKIWFGGQLWYLWGSRRFRESLAQPMELLPLFLIIWKPMWCLTPGLGWRVRVSKCNSVALKMNSFDTFDLEDRRFLWEASDFRSFPSAISK